MSDAGGIGGSANELGSWHRAGAAAYLAVHGLVDRPLLGRSGDVPVVISLEADEAVDDIVCTMAHGTKWFIQSKRTAGMGASLRATARQWAGQELSNGDRVVLVSHHLRGVLSRLQRHIERAIRGDPLSTSAKTEIDRFVTILEDEGVSKARGLLERIQLVQWQVEEAGDPDLEAAVAMLANTIVRNDQASQAFDVLRQRMQQAATRRETTTVRDWVECLGGAGLEVFADGGGPRGARERAYQCAIDDYRFMLAAGKNRLDLSALVTDMPEIVVDDALRGWNVSWTTNEYGQRVETEVMNVVRGTPRLVIAGLPGMGKSELTRQLAAYIATEPFAPLPILVDLRQITAEVHSSADVTLDLLLNRPSRSVTGGDPAVLHLALTDVVVRGEAVLLIDGLDEAQRKRGQVAAGMSRLLAELPDSDGLILTTRDSALGAAEVLDLPEVRLETPSNLRRAMTQLISALAPRRTSTVDSSAWAAAKSEELEEAFDRHSDIWQIPLLATLATARLASDREETTSIAVLLNQVIEDSVRDWELRRAAGREELEPDLTADMLLAGFAEIGHCLVGDPSITPATALAAVRRSLTGWRLAPPVEKALARQIVLFWDDRVGVFVDQGDGIFPRSRQFAEIAEVRWLSDQDEAVRREWLQNAIADNLYENAVALATTMDHVARDALVRAASRDNTSASRNRAATWLSELWASWDDSPQQQLLIVDILGDAAEDRLERTPVNRWTRTPTEDDRGWPFALSLVTAPRRPDIDSRRRERVDALALSPERRSIVEALTGLIDAKAEARPLDQEALDAVERVIYAPRPEQPEPRRDDDGRIVIEASRDHVSGVGEIVERSIEYLDQLGPAAPDTLHRLGKRQSMRVYGRISRLLQARGYPDPDPWWAHLNFPAELAQLHEDHQGLGWLLREIDQLAPAVEDETHDSWRFGELGRLLDVLGYSETTLGDYTGAVHEESAVLAAWIAAHIEAFDIDSSKVGREARQLLAMLEPEAAIDSLVYGRLKSDKTFVGLGEATALALMAPAESGSEWIADTSIRLLIDTRYPSVAIALSELRHPVSWRRTFTRNLADALNSADPEARVSAMSESARSSIRAAAGAILDNGEVDRPDILALLRTDRDGQVRHYSGGDPVTAEMWSCSNCDGSNGPDQPVCPQCRAGRGW